MNGLVLLPILLGAERRVEPRLRLAGLIGERMVEGVARLVGDAAAGGGDQRLAVSGAAQTVFAEKAESLQIGARRVVIALEAHIARRNDRPAFAVVGCGDQMGFNAGDRRLDAA